MTALLTSAYAAASPAAALAPMQIERREPGPQDVLLDILYCGVCHSDIHFAGGLFPGLIFPLVPGHEIIGKVAAVGTAVTAHRPGDIVGVGVMVDSCRVCDECSTGHEQFCDSMIPTYGGVHKDHKTPTYGGYSTRITVDQDFVLRIPPQLSPAATAPLLCAGITTYSPLRHWNVGKGSRVAIIGLGGLGHVAVKIATAMGAEVTVLSTSERKRADALRMGAVDFADSTDAASFSRLAGRFELILNTVSANLNYDAYLSLLRRDGTLVMLGYPDGPVSMNALGLLVKRRSVAGSPIGSLRQTQEMLDFCAEHRIAAEVEVIPIDRVNEAYQRVLQSDVRYRFVLDMASLR